MLRLLFAILRSRLLWRGALVVTVAAIAFWLAFAATAVVMVGVVGSSAIESDPAQLVRVAVPVSLVAALAAIVAVGVVALARRRGRIRQWLPLREAMLHDAGTLPSTHVAQVLNTPSPAAGGHVIAVDLITGYQGPLRLPGYDVPRGSVVCFSETPDGPQVRTWMTGQLWRACEREAARTGRRTTRAFARTERDQRQAAEQQIRDAAKETVAEAERILRERDWS
jgi:type IV secretory pathway protease TraF